MQVHGIEARPKVLCGVVRARDALAVGVLCHIRRAEARVPEPTTYLVEGDGR